MTDGDTFSGCAIFLANGVGGALPNFTAAAAKAKFGLLEGLTNGGDCGTLSACTILLANGGGGASPIFAAAYAKV